MELRPPNEIRDMLETASQTLTEAGEASHDDVADFLAGVCEALTWALGEEPGDGLRTLLDTAIVDLEEQFGTTDLIEADYHRRHEALQADVPLSTEFQLPKRAASLTSVQRKAVLAVIDAMLNP